MFVTLWLTYGRGRGRPLSIELIVWIPPCERLRGSMVKAAIIERQPRQPESTYG